MGVISRNQIEKLDAVASLDPTVTDDSTKEYLVGSRWLNSLTKVLWESVDDTPGAADWRTTTIASAADPEIDHIISLNITVPINKIRIGRNIHIQDGVELRILNGAEYLLI